MRKIMAILLAMAALVSLAACGTAAPENTQAPNTTQAPGATTGDAAAETTAPVAPTDSQDTAPVSYTFDLNGVKLVPGAAFDPSALPEAASVYQVPSCAIEGTDNVYNYETVEVTAFNDGTGEIIYSIYVIDANTPTPEGLYLGDDIHVINELYGTDRTENGNELTYQKDGTMLILILQNDCVISIEYRAVTA